MARKLHARTKNPKCISKLMKSKINRPRSEYTKRQMIFHFVLFITQLLVKNSNMGKLDQIYERHVDSLQYNNTIRCKFIV